MLLTILLIAAIVCGVAAAVLAVSHRPWQGALTGGVILFVIWLILTYVVH